MKQCANCGDDRCPYHNSWAANTPSLIGCWIPYLPPPKRQKRNFWVITKTFEGKTVFAQGYIGAYDQYVWTENWINAERFEVRPHLDDLRRLAVFGKAEKSAKLEVFAGEEVRTLNDKAEEPRGANGG
jgi:hypothetical protein